MYDECVNTYRQERTKTEKLLGDLLPKQVIQQMKKVVLDNHSLFIVNISNNKRFIHDRFTHFFILNFQGSIPKPENFKSVTIFLCDIVSFTTLSVESTANQIVEMLNNLYNLFDERIDNFDVYKVM